MISASGGTGNTTVAANRPISLAKNHNRCGLFDFDLRGSDVATYLGLKPRHTVADVCRSIDKLDLSMWEQSLLEHDSGVSVLAGLESWDDAKYITGEGLQKIVRFGRGVLPQSSSTSIRSGLPIAPCLSPKSAAGSSCYSGSILPRFATRRVPCIFCKESASRRTVCNWPSAATESNGISLPVQAEAGAGPEDSPLRA